MTVDGLTGEPLLKAMVYMALTEFEYIASHNEPPPGTTIVCLNEKPSGADQYALKFNWPLAKERVRLLEGIRELVWAAWHTVTFGDITPDLDITDFSAWPKRTVTISPLYVGPGSEPDTLAMRLWIRRDSI